MAALLNAAGYQAVWIVAVLAAARGAPHWGVLAAAGFVLVQWAFSAARRADALLAAAALLTGVLLDGALAASGWMRYAAAQPALGAPAWILAIWVAFALTLGHSLRFLQRRPRAAALLGAIGGPLAYVGAGELGAVAFDAPVPALVALALAWAVALPALLQLAAHAGTRMRGAAEARP